MSALPKKLFAAVSLLSAAVCLVTTSYAGVASSAIKDSGDAFANLSSWHVGVATTWTVGNYLDTKNHHIFYPAVGFMGKRLTIMGPTASYRVLGPKSMHVAVAAALLPNEFDPKDSTNTQMQQLNKRNYSMVAGLKGVLILSSLGAFTVNLDRAFISGDGGYFASAAFTTRLSQSLGPAKVSFLPSIGAEYFSNKLANYYYGISQAEATKSGFKQYSPTSAIAPYVNLALLTQFSSRIRLYVAVKAARMPDAIMNSPMVSKRYGFTTTAGLTYAL